MPIANKKIIIYDDTSIKNKLAKELPQFDTVCFFCWGLIGDVFIRVPIIELFKEYYPEARITCIVDPVAKQVLQHHPGVDEVFVFNRNKSRKLGYILKTLANIIKLRNKKFDLSINLYSGGSSPFVSRLINAKVRLGFDHTHELRKANTITAVHPEFCCQWILDFATILNPLGVPAEKVRVGTSFYYSKSDNEYAKQILQDSSKKYFCINLGARVSSKCWDINNFVLAAEKIAEKYTYIPVIINNPGMEYISKEFSNKYKGEMIKLPLLSLGKVGAIIARCNYMITGDTSLMHVSFAVKTPTLVIFTYTRPEWHIVDDCLNVFCFKEDNKSINRRCNKPWGEKDIKVDDICKKFEQLVNMTNDV